ncbi:hypothetical protein L914_15631 [Phytophthora nicotianae]|uniref:BZIP domain-containing protein n=1 Tax=Phytophthora nicotianae TaxID=4792 RepID=W2MR37_PHYNI|nr:hypothetical protein L914_15631 [Phytophthora nicotianae]
MTRVLHIFEQFEPHPIQQALSSDVIGCVLPRAPSARDLVHVNAGKISSYTSSAARNTDGLANKGQTNQPKPTLEPRKNSHISAPTKSSLERSSPKRHRKRRAKATAEHREQRRVDQERYRKKKAQREHDLAKVVKRLSQEVPLLQMQHMRMAFGVKLTLEAVVTKYFQLFRYGVQFSNETSSCYLKARSQQQLVFLRMAMSNDVTLGELRGVEALLEQWKRCSTYFVHLELHQGEVSNPSPNFIWACATLSVTITKTTLEEVLSQLIEIEQDYRLELRSRLLGQQLALPCRVCFEWDESSKRVVRLETMVDFFTPLLDVLGCVEYVALVMQKLLITLEGIIGL